MAAKSISAGTATTPWGVLFLACALSGCAHRAVSTVDLPPAPTPEVNPALPGSVEAMPPGPTKRSIDEPLPVYHVVTPGQTTWRIARAYGLTVDELAAANDLPDANRIEVGQRLRIPGAASPVDVPPYRPLAQTGEPWTWPVPDGRVLSYFGAARRDHRHQGMDIGAQHGQKVLAAKAGRVVYSGSGMRGYGKTVMLDHGDGLQSLYAHNSALLVAVGQRVRQGETIAKVGRTGNASTDHCHLEVRRNDAPVDPLIYLGPGAESRQ